MDAIDRKILKVLQADARASLQQVGQAVGLSASPCWERIRKMEAAGVIDLSEGGACLEWTLPDDVPCGTPVRLCFLLGDNQALEIDGTLKRIFGGRAGVEFAPDQRDLVRQLLAEVKSEDY